MKRKSTKPEPKTDDVGLPPDVRESDKKGKWEDRLSYAEYAAVAEGWYGDLTFYYVKGTGWVLCTLHISNPSKRQAAGTPARFYSIGLADSKVYTVGRGPHVLATVRIEVTKANKDRLQKYLDLYRDGLEKASTIRDRISSRRAQGQIHRANGESSWRW